MRTNEEIVKAIHARSKELDTEKQCRQRLSTIVPIILGVLLILSLILVINTLNNRRQASKTIEVPNQGMSITQTLPEPNGTEENSR